MDASDDEPSLGSFDRMINQANWSKTTSAAAWAVEDAELDDSDREYSGGESRPGADDSIFPRVQRGLELEVDTMRQASDRLGEIVSRVTGLVDDGQRRPSHSICNVIPLSVVRL